MDIFPKKVAGTAVNADHLVNESSEHGSVELRFELDGSEYCLHRSLPGRRVSLKRADEEIAAGIRTVAEKLVSLLGVDVKLFQNIFFSDQDELRRSLDFSPEERRVFIERLLGVEEWKWRIEFLRETKRALEGFLDDLASGRLGAFLAHIEELEDDIATRRDEVGELQDTVRELEQSAPRDVRKLRLARDKSQNTIAALQHKQLDLRTRLDIEERTREGVRKGRCPTCTQEIPRGLKTSRLKILERSLRDLAKQLAKINRDLQKAEDAFREVDYDESEDAFGDLREARATHAEAARQVLADEQRLKRLRKQAKTFGKKPEQIDRTKAEIAFLVRLEEAIQLFRKSLRRRLVRQLALGTNDFLARFHDGDNDSVVKMDEDLNISVQLHGRDVPIFNLSGAAKDILALALRYGLLRVAASGINFLVLDEPTRHMDTSNCQRLKGLFNDLLDRQLIVVTVNSEFSDAVGRHFRVAKDDSLRSVVTESW